MAIVPPQTTKTTCRTLRVPDSPEWLGVVSGVLVLLSYGYHWNDDTPEQLDRSRGKEAGREILRSWLDNLPCSGELCQAVVDSLLEAGGNFEAFAASFGEKLLASCEVWVYDEFLDLSAFPSVVRDYTGDVDELSWWEAANLLETEGEYTMVKPQFRQNGCLVEVDWGEGWEPAFSLDGGECGDLIGPSGPQGPAGPTGPQGPAGQDGEDGEDGAPIDPRETKIPAPQENDKPSPCDVSYAAAEMSSEFVAQFAGSVTDLGTAAGAAAVAVGALAALGVVATGGIGLGFLLGAVSVYAAWTEQRINDTDTEAGRQELQEIVFSNLPANPETISGAHISDITSDIDGNANLTADQKKLYKDYINSLGPGGLYNTAITLDTRGSDCGGCAINTSPSLTEGTGWPTAPLFVGQTIEVTAIERTGSGTNFDGQYIVSAALSACCATFSMELTGYTHPDHGDAFGRTPCGGAVEVFDAVPASTGSVEHFWVWSNTPFVATLTVTALS